MSPPIDWTALEDAIHDWVAAATGIPGERVYFVEPEQAGLVLPVVPAAQIETLSHVRLGAPEIHKVPGLTKLRVTIASDGPGDAGVLFYPGGSLTPIAVSLAAGPGDPPATTAAALAVELAAAVTPGYAVSIDPANSAAVLVEASEAAPVFALAPSDPAFTAVTISRARFVEVETAWTRLTWRVTLRSETARGFGSAKDMLSLIHARIDRALRPALGAIGWLFKGVLASLPSLPADRTEFRAALDFAVEGYATSHYNLPSARAIGLQLAV